MSRSERLFDLFNRACDLPADDRDAFLERECQGDATLLSEVRALLAADADAARDTFWSKSAVAHSAAAEAALAGTAAGSRLGQYRLIAPIGSGGMGTVYKAVRDDREFDQVVAIKVLKPTLDAERIVSRFKAERQILATLDHPNIARLIDGGSDASGLPYLVMEYVDGVSPLEYSERHHLSTAQRIALFLPVCSAIHYAHQRMVIHRDVKPGNILVTADGTPKLLDFGIAKLVEPDGHAQASTLTADSGAMLTVRYASPEQINGETHLTTASDVYSLAVCLYELLTGRWPYAKADRPPAALLRAVCEDDPIAPGAINPALRGDIDNILLKALQKQPRDRYGSADQFAEDLRRHLAGLPVLARGDSPMYVAAMFVRRHKAIVTAVVLLILSLAGGLIATQRAQARADRRFEDVRRLARSVVFDYHDAIQGLPGSTPVRERLVKDALAYLDALSAEGGDPDLQREVIDAYVRVSNVQGNSYYDNLGDTAGGLASARRAVQLSEALLAANDDPASLRSAAGAHHAEGSLLYSAGELQETEARFRKSLELFEQAAAGYRDDTSFALAHAEALGHLADLYGAPGIQNLGRTGEAAALYRDANALIERAAAARPDDADIRHRRYQMVMQLASVDAAQGRITEAAQGFRVAMSLAEAASAARPDHVLDKQEISNIALRIAILLMDARQFESALPYVDRSLSIMSALSSADPKNALFKRNTSVIENHYARALLGAGRPAEALSHNQSSLAIALSLSKDDPASAELRGDVAISRRRMAETLIALGRHREAVTAASEAEAVLTQLAGAGDASYRAQHGRALRVLAEARLGAGDVTGARAPADRAEAIARSLSESDSSNATFKADLELARTIKEKTQPRTP